MFLLPMSVIYSANKGSRSKQFATDQNGIFITLVVSGKQVVIVSHKCKIFLV